MPIQFTVDRVVTQMAEGQEHVQSANEADKPRVTQITKYNLLASALNASTVLLTIAVAAAAFFAYTTAFVLGSVALFTRLAVLKEMDKYTLPVDQVCEGNQVNEARPQRSGRELWGRARQAVLDPIAYIGAQLRHVINIATQEEREANLFERLGLVKPEGWNQHEVFVFDYPVWNNPVPLDCERVPAQGSEEVAPEARRAEVDAVRAGVGAVRAGVGAVLDILDAANPQARRGNAEQDAAQARRGNAEENAAAEEAPEQFEAEPQLRRLHQAVPMPMETE